MPADPKKVQALRASGTLNSHPEKVRVPRFAEKEFFDPNDLVQLKYETLRAVEVDGQRASALRFADPMVQALYSALLVFHLLPRGFSNRELRNHWAPLLGKKPQSITPGQMTYHLRRLRLHGFIERQAGTHSYQVTDKGLQVALFFTQSYARLIRPGLGAVSLPPLPSDNRLQRAFAQVKNAMDNYGMEKLDTKTLRKTG
jgi:hypothetical protein